MADTSFPAVVALAALAPEEYQDDMPYYYRLAGSAGYLVSVLNGEEHPVVVLAVLSPVTEGFFIEMDPPVRVSPGRTAWFDLQRFSLSWCTWQLSQADLGIMLSGGITTRSRHARPEEYRL
jgi:hypothetical protein